MEVTVLCEEEQDTEPQQSLQETKQTDDEDAELIFVGVEHVNKDAELIFLGVTSNSKPVISNILNRVTPGSRLRRNQGHLRKNTAYRLKPTSHPDMTPLSEEVSVLPASASPYESRSTDSPIIIEPLQESNVMSVLPASLSDSRSTDSPIIIEPLQESNVMSVLPASLSDSRSTDSPIIIEPLQEFDYKNTSAQVLPSSSSKSCSPMVTFTSSLHHPVKAALSVGDMKESLCISKRPSTCVEAAEASSSVLSSSGTCHTVTPQPSMTSSQDCVSLNHVQNGAPSPTTFPKDSVHFSPTKVNPDRENGLSKSDCSSVESQTCDPKKENLILLLSDFYYGQHQGNAQQEQKTHTGFKCLLCLKVLKNIKFMNHVKHHLELEKQSGDSWENHTSCQHCHRDFPTPFHLERHIDSVHTAQDPPAVCKICELSFETDQVLLQHMKDNHKPGEMPYVCLVCNYRSSVFADVEVHFKKCHVNTKNLLCPFCLKIFKTGKPYMCHYRGHWERNAHQCSKCRLQFLTFKEKMEHKTQCHQMFKKPKQLEGLPPETKVVIQVSLEPSQSGSVNVASITVSTTDSEI